MARTTAPLRPAGAALGGRWEALPEGDKGIIAAGLVVAAVCLCLCLAVVAFSP